MRRSISTMAQMKGVNLAQVARTIQAALSGQAVGASAAATDFAELSSHLHRRGRRRWRRTICACSIRSCGLTATGLVNIGAQTIDMRIAPRAVNQAQGQGGDASVAGLGIPFRVSGPWSRVSFRPALEEIVQNQLRDILERQGEDNPLGASGRSAVRPHRRARTTRRRAATGGRRGATPAPAHGRSGRAIRCGYFQSSDPARQKQETRAAPTPKLRFERDVGFRRRDSRQRQQAADSRSPPPTCSAVSYCFF